MAERREVLERALRELEKLCTALGGRVGGREVDHGVAIECVLPHGSHISMKFSDMSAEFHRAGKTVRIPDDLDIPIEQINLDVSGSDYEASNTYHKLEGEVKRLKGGRLIIHYSPTWRFLTVWHSK